MSRTTIRPHSKTHISAHSNVNPNRMYVNNAVGEFLNLLIEEGYNLNDVSRHGFGCSGSTCYLYKDNTRTPSIQTLTRAVEHFSDKAYPPKIRRAATQMARAVDLKNAKKLMLPGYTFSRFPIR